MRGPARRRQGPKRTRCASPLLAALGRRPQGVRKLAELVGGTRSTTPDALEELEATGWPRRPARVAGWSLL